MKAIDLHIHTFATISDSEFTFSMDSLKRYVEKMELDIIAITNHNIFNCDQFLEIDRGLEIKVLPGIEINFEGGHLLLISENNKLIDFSEKCQNVYEKIVSVHDTINLDELKEIFGDLNNYLLIPHNPKKPKVPMPIIREMTDYVNAIEVSSIKDFLREYKDNEEFVPLWFSDIRISSKLDDKKRGRTYLDIEEDSLSSIKMALLNKSKVKLTIDELNRLFPINNEGVQISTGLNVLMGERSSGKSYFLNEVEECNFNVKHIKQFSLLDKQDSNTKEFNVRLSNENSLQGEKRFSELKDVIEEICSVDINQNKRNIEEYVNSLVKFATEEERRDVFSKASLYTQNLYVLKDTKSLNNLIKSTETLIENKEYREIIDKYLAVDSLRNLLIELSFEGKKLSKDNFIKFQVNEMIGEIKQKLEVKTTSTKIEDVDLRSYIDHKDRILKFNQICELVKNENVIKLEKIGKFDLVMTTGKYNNVTEIKERTKNSIALADMFKENYQNGYLYLKELQKLNISQAEYWKYFVNIKFDIYNEYGLPASGGERAEYNLLNEIKTANNSDILLIDEPESSFDNIFLNTEVNEMIKYLSKKMPVILATHNNTVGLSIAPDYLLYTKRTAEGKEAKFTMYCGNVDSEHLFSCNDKEAKIPTKEALMNLFEAGEQAYKGRRKIYELYQD